MDLFMYYYTFKDIEAAYGLGNRLRNDYRRLIQPELITQIKVEKSTLTIPDSVNSNLERILHKSKAKYKVVHVPDKP
jgi:hypothetical protein